MCLSSFGLSAKVSSRHKGQEDRMQGMLKKYWIDEVKQAGKREWAERLSSKDLQDVLALASPELVGTQGWKLIRLGFGDESADLPGPRDFFWTKVLIHEKRREVL